MKKLFVISFSSIIILIMNTSLLKAGCPPGASSNTFIYTVAGCEYTFEVCYECTPSGSPGWFSFGNYKKNDPLCINGINMNTVKDSVRNQMHQNILWLYSLCTDDIPPCGLGVDKWQEREYDCWYMYGNYDDTIEYRICDFGSYCVRDLDVCFDQTYGPIVTPTSGWYHHGTSNCDVNSTMPSYPDPGYASDCWFNTICGQ